jgi:hypothetical protein
VAVGTPVQRESDRFPKLRRNHSMRSGM